MAFTRFVHDNLSGAMSVTNSFSSANWKISHPILYLDNGYFSTDVVRADAPKRRALMNR
jgi:hypothetical protein